MTIKILREIGSVAYNQGVALISGPDSGRFDELKQRIQREFVGPDCYWKDPARPATAGCTRFFGNAWFVPFPPTVVSRSYSTMSSRGLKMKRDAWCRFCGTMMDP